MIKQENALFDYIAKIISDYPETERYIKEREDELTNQFQEFRDENVGGGKAQFKNNTGVEAMAITLATDKRLANLEKHAKAVDTCLTSCDELMHSIIDELYLHRHQYLTIQGIAQKFDVSERSVRNYRNRFFEHVADQLGL